MTTEVNILPACDKMSGGKSLEVGNATSDKSDSRDKMISLRRSSSSTSGTGSSNSVPSSDFRSDQQYSSSPESSDVELEHICFPSVTDVLCGRGRRYNVHPGNVEFRRIVQERKGEYCLASARDRKTEITKEVMDRVASYGGRFLVRVKTDTTMHDKTLSESMEWPGGVWVKAEYGR